MWSLNDILAKETRNSKVALVHCTSQLQELGKRRKAEQERIRTLDAEFKEAQETAEKSRADIIAIDERIEALRAELRELQDSQAEVMDRIAKEKRDQHRGEKAQSKFDHQIRELAEKKLEIESQLLSDRRKAMQVFLTESADRFRHLRLEQNKLAERQAKRREFEEIRHKDSALMAQWEEFQEYEKLLSMSIVPAVKLKLQRHQNLIKKKIEQVYPKVLSGGTGETSEQYVETLYWMKDPHTACIKFFLPVPEGVWERLAEGQLDDRGTSALLCVWGIARWLDKKRVKAHIAKENQWVVLRTESNEKALADLQGIEIPLPGGPSAYLQPGELPDSVQEAIARQ
ncbi:hypothetical protein CH330_05675 [candidate division WOR-3 bacterium JGI_Cruoil_03_51_56]|uniref:Uncharacterized protein n=1 Tax=candidate division WOR-3 bacterium JGI_Cruoil_03_51_56 TaxID=1973747 RepID=A0A235BTD7_UNCW3|nr:MAG: hypothetical protein CH330_05675 [candidate division WOR-3 bacterium JGI_Cruoil_03_51_56]